MEGISRTRLEPPRLEGALADAPREKRRAEVEIHKVRLAPHSRRSCSDLAIESFFMS
jgi:hypothetical protein